MEPDAFDTTPDTEGTYTSSEVAALFRVNYKTVQRWASLGLLTSRRIGRAGWRRFPIAEVHAKLDAHDPLACEHDAFDTCPACDQL